MSGPGPIHVRHPRPHLPHPRPGPVEVDFADQKLKGQHLIVAGSFWIVWIAAGPVQALRWIFAVVVLIIAFAVIPKFKFS